VNITGHTDSLGDSDANKRLGKERANMVKEILIDMGASPGQLITYSQGEEQPIADNSTPEGREKNRRVEIEPE
jgi:OOP family OmpA-OmpF porin